MIPSLPVQPPVDSDSTMNLFDQCRRYCAAMITLAETKALIRAVDDARRRQVAVEAQCRAQGGMFDPILNRWVPYREIPTK